MIEQLHATQLRLAVETAPGNGVAAGAWLKPPTVAAAVSRGFKNTAQRLDVFRQPRSREVVAEAWVIRSTHEVGLPFLRWLLEPHGIDRGGDVWTFDPEAVGPTFVLDTETQQGHRALFSGLSLVEVQLQFEESRIVKMECQWAGLRRTTPATELPAAALEFSGGLLATFRGAAAATTGAWDVDPRANQPINCHGAQLFFQRQVQAVDYGPDGVPSTHSRAPWRVLGEAYMPETTGITDTAFSDSWQGKVGLWFGPGSEHLRVNNAQGYVTDDDLKGYDFRVRRLVFEGFTDDRRAVAEFRA